jgi:hypothetical protein
MTGESERPHGDHQVDRREDPPIDESAIDPSGGVGDLGEESGTASWQPARGTRAIAPSAGEGLWVG